MDSTTLVDVATSQRNGRCGNEESLLGYIVTVTLNFVFFANLHGPSVALSRTYCCGVQ